MTQEGFKKIEIKTENIPLRNYKKIKNNNLFRIIINIFLILVIPTAIFFGGLFLLFRDINPLLQETVSKAKETALALKAQDLENGTKKLEELKISLVKVQSKVNQISFLKILPLLGVYVSDAQHFANSGVAGVEAGIIAVNTITPYADLLGLKGKSTFVSGSADDRIKTAVETFDKMTPKIDEISEKIKTVGQELDYIDPGRYPEKIGSTLVREKIMTAKNIFSQSASLFVEAQPFLKKLPELMGNKESKTYLVIFQNDAELRATGGFITAYAIFRVNKGKLQVIKADDIYKLDDSKKRKFPAPPPILKYHKNVTTLELRDSNLSPDFITSMNEFEKMITESIPDFPKFDGIVSLDTHVFVQSIKILGDFNVYGRNFSAENDPRCDCPKAIYELEDYSTKPVAYVREERKDIIGVLLYQLLQKALGVSPSQYWGKLFQMFLEEAQQKHVLFYFHDTEAQKGIDTLNYSGKIVSSPGNYLHINNVNFAGAKSNMFVKTSIKQEIELQGDGSILTTLSINYKNQFKASNCNLEAGQLCLNGILRNWLRVYVPAGSKLIQFKGSEKETLTYDELGKTVFEGFLTVNPQGQTEVVIKYSIPGNWKKGETLPLLIQKQPGTQDLEYLITYQGREVIKFNLLTDRTVQIKL